MNNDPKWGDMIDTDEFVGYFGIKSGFGPYEGDKMLWNRCWSHVPRLWAEPITKLIKKIEAKYTLERVSDKDREGFDVTIDQVKDTFGTLRVYFEARDDTIRADVYRLIEECIDEIKLIDTHYGEPW